MRLILCSLYALSLQAVESVYHPDKDYVVAVINHYISTHKSYKKVSYSIWGIELGESVRSEINLNGKEYVAPGEKVKNDTDVLKIQLVKFGVELQNEKIPDDMVVLDVSTFDTVLSGVLRRVWIQQKGNKLEFVKDVGLAQF